MRITDFHDAPSITAQYFIGEHERAATREAILAEARSTQSQQYAYLTRMGHQLVRLGEWLQSVAKHPVAMEETV